MVIMQSSFYIYAEVSWMENDQIRSLMTNKTQRLFEYNYIECEKTNEIYDDVAVNLQKKKERRVKIKRTRDKMNVQDAEEERVQRQRRKKANKEELEGENSKCKGVKMKIAPAIIAMCCSCFGRM